MKTPLMVLIGIALAVNAFALGFPPISDCPPEVVKMVDQSEFDQRTLGFIELLIDDWGHRPGIRGKAEACFEIFLKAGFDLNGKRRDGTYATPHALFELASNPKITRRLLENGADIKLESELGKSILLWGAKHYSFEEFKFWSQKIGLPEKHTPAAYEILGNALNRETSDFATYLIKKGVSSINTEILHRAMTRGNYEVLKLLLETVRIPEHQYALDHALYLAAFGEQSNLAKTKDILRRILAAGAKIDSMQDNSKVSPLTAALLFSKTSDTAKELIALGANVKKSDEAVLELYQSGQESFLRDLVPGLLAIAARYGKSDLIKPLLKLGARLQPMPGAKTDALAEAILAGDLNAARILLENNFPLNASPQANELIPRAIQNKSLPTIKLLIKYGALVNALDASGAAPLHKAAAASDLEIIKILVEAGADTNMRSTNGQTPLQYLLNGDCNAKKIAYFLALPNIDLRALTGARVSQNTLFHVAAKNKSCGKEALTLIAKAGIPIENKSLEGLTPLHIAVEKQNLNVANFLVELGANPTIKTADGKSLEELLPNISTDEIKSLRNIRAKYEWVNWSKNLNHPTDEALLKSTLRVFANEDKKLPQLPEHASPTLKQYYDALNEGLIKPKNAPWEITAKPLDITEMPAEYYRKILVAGKSSESRQQDKFKPTPEQTRTVLKAMVADGAAKNQDYELMAWLISASKLPLDLETLELFNFDSDKIRHDVDEMIKTKPLEYKGAPTLAAIKLGKAILSHDDADFVCSENVEGLRASTKNQNIADILNWLGVYGDSPAAEQGFVARIVRMVLEKKKVCDQDRDFLLRAMRGWGRIAAPAHHETTCSILSTVKSRPMSERSLQELLLITQSIGLRSELSEAAWFEQIKAFAETHPDASKPFGENLMQVYMGLLRYTLGNPAAIQKSESNQVKVQASDARHGTIAKLCRIMRSDNPEIAAAGKVWIETLKADLDKPRRWPTDIAFETAPTSPSTLAQEFEAQKLSVDLGMIRSECADLPVQPSKPEPEKTKPQAAPKAKPITQPFTDFNPRGRTHK